MSTSTLAYGADQDEAAPRITQHAGADALSGMGGGTMFHDELDRKLRESGHDATWLADEVGVSTQAVRNWLAGGKPTQANVVAIEDVLDCPNELGHLLGFARPDAPGANVIRAITADESLDEEAKRDLIRLYKAFVKRRFH